MALLYRPLLAARFFEQPRYSVVFVLIGKLL
jgi:hypothetical protein